MISLKISPQTVWNECDGSVLAEPALFGKDPSVAKRQLPLVSPKILSHQSPNFIKIGKRQKLSKIINGKIRGKTTKESRTFQ